MKKAWIYFFIAIFFLTSCGQNNTNEAGKNDNTKTEPSVDSADLTVPGVEKLAFTDSINLKANENMRFDNELFRVKTGQKIKLFFTNTSAKSNAAMSHNVVVLKKGTDIADFADVAHNAKNEQYVPSSLDSLVIAHTALVSAGESVQIEFTITIPGVYDYICSFPGHWGTMQGKIVAEQ